MRDPAEPDISQVPARDDPEPGPVAHSGRARADVRVRPRRAASRARSRHRRSSARGASAPTAGGMLTADYGRISAAPRVRHARSVDAGQRRRRLGSPDPHPLRGRADPRAQRQPRQRAARGSAGARTSTGCGRAAASPSPAVPRLGRHVHGALPQHHARGQRDAAALGDQRRRRAVPGAAADAGADAAGRARSTSRIKAAHGASDASDERRVPSACAQLWRWSPRSACGCTRPRPAAQNARWGANYFPNVTLTTQDGATVRFYDDLIKGKIVAINLIYTTCKFACPLETARLAQVQQLARRRHGARRLLLLDHDRSGARHAGGPQGLRGEVPRRARLAVPHRHAGRHRSASAARSACIRTRTRRTRTATRRTCWSATKPPASGCGTRASTIPVSWRRLLRAG